MSQGRAGASARVRPGSVELCPYVRMCDVCVRVRRAVASWYESCVCGVGSGRSEVHKLIRPGLATTIISFFYLLAKTTCGQRVHR
jgi:hypothetical protein